MEITINIPAWVIYSFIALWVIDKAMIVYKKILEWKLKRIQSKNTGDLMK